MAELVEWALSNPDIHGLRTLLGPILINSNTYRVFTRIYVAEDHNAMQGLRPVMHP